jgi:hypothetical protein
MSEQKECGLTSHSIQRNITANIRKWCNEEAEQKHLNVLLGKATARAFTTGR